MTNQTIAGAPGHIDAPIDWVAYAAVQQRLLKCRNSFACNCLEEAANRILSGRSYRHHGIKLATTLENDCRKSTFLRRIQPIFLGLNTEMVAETADHESGSVAEADLRWAESTVRDFLSALPPRLLTLIIMEVSGSSREQIAAAMGIAARQFRNLRREVFMHSQESTDFMHALSLLRMAGPDGVSIFQATVLTLDAIRGNRTNGDCLVVAVPKSSHSFSN